MVDDNASSRAYESKSSNRPSAKTNPVIARGRDRPERDRVVRAIGILGSSEVAGPIAASDLRSRPVDSSGRNNCRRPGLDGSSTTLSLPAKAEAIVSAVEPEVGQAGDPLGPRAGRRKASASPEARRCPDRPIGLGVLDRRGGQALGRGRGGRVR